jgi:hypothetical protein
MSTSASTTGNLLLVLIDLAHRARAADGADELAFLLVNDTHRLFPYRQAALWFAEGGIRSLSGVVQPESNAPYTLWLADVCRHLSAQPTLSATRRVVAGDLPPELAAQWQEWLPAAAVWFVLPAAPERPGSTPGGLLLASDTPCGDESLALLGEWLDTWRHAWLARFHAPAWSITLWRQKFLAWWRSGRDAPWWRRRPFQIVGASLLVLIFPVRLSVVAPGELVAAQPAIVRAPLDGVIDHFEVRPNQTVKAEQALFSFDEAAIVSRLEVARQELATAEAEYRQSAQIALNDPRGKGQLAGLLGKIGEKRAEADFLGEQLQRAHVVAPQDGIALFDDPTEWIGKPVQTGERVMRIARPEDAEIEAWLAIGDAIPLADGASVSLFLAATPFSPIGGKLRYVGHDAIPRPDGSYAYRLRATIVERGDQRIGLKGTVRVYGQWVPLAYWMLRRPLATIRQWLVY